MLETLNAETFSTHLNTTFRIRLTESECLDLELIEIDSARERPRQEQFSIVFRGAKEKAVAQGTYPMDHERLGSFDLFLVPVSWDDQFVYYQAVFNRLRK
jgi:hypothetical protein